VIALCFIICINSTQREKRHKIILEVNDVSVKYRPKVSYFFRSDLSYGSENDNITLLNVPFVVSNLKRNTFKAERYFTKRRRMK
jgi:hypothetical protein